MKKISLALTLVAGFTMAAFFQNCSKANFASSNKIASGANKIGEEGNKQVSKYTHVYHHLTTDKSGADPSGIELQASLVEGIMVLTDTNGYGNAYKEKSARRCDIDSARLAKLNSLLANAEICHDADYVSKDAVSCLGMAMTDIRLVNKSLKQPEVELRPDLCNNGIGLCEGDDTLRAILKSLIESPPKGCELVQEAI